MKTQLTVEVGQRFGRLTVLNDPGPAEHGHRRAICRCDCGTVKVYRLSHLRSGATRSCGCLSRALAAERRRGQPALNRTHGVARHPLYGAWLAMLDRCENPQHVAYRRYGGRGIKVCDRWHDPAVFIADIERWLGPRPDRMTLDRICNDHDYRLDNVRWATRSEQQRNKAPFDRPGTCEWRLHVADGYDALARRLEDQ